MSSLLRFTQTRSESSRMPSLPPPGLNAAEYERLTNLVSRFLLLAKAKPLAASIVLDIGDFVLKFFDA